VSADDFGRFEADPSVVGAACFPRRLDRLKSATVQRWLDEMAAQSIIIFYEVEGKKYLLLKNWPKYQQTRAKHSKYPAPSSDNICKQMISSDNKCARPTTYDDDLRPTDQTTNGFDEFWKSYPKKQARKDALKAWKALVTPDLEAILSGLEQAVGSESWQKEEGKYIPLPATWLRGARWEDEPPPAPPDPYGPDFPRFAWCDRCQDNHEGTLAVPPKCPFKEVLNDTIKQ